MLTFEAGYPELLEIAARTVHRVLTEHVGIEDGAATKAAMQCAEAIRGELGGTSLYIPKGASVELSHRDWELYAQFTGDNVDGLARSFDLSVVRVRQILARCRAADIASRQRGFGFE